MNRALVFAAGLGAGVLATGVVAAYVAERQTGSSSGTYAPPSSESSETAHATEPSLVREATSVTATAATQKALAATTGSAGTPLTTQPEDVKQDAEATTSAPPLRPEPLPTTPRSVPPTLDIVTTVAQSAPAIGAYRVPVERAERASWAREHHDYPATDVFAGCGTALVSPASGILTEVRRTDGWTSSVDNPATRGGKSLTIVGDDGVRYYLAHFDSIEPGLEPGRRVQPGDRLGSMGTTGRSSGCHLHFALSPPCPGKEWSVRRGVVWPWRYLDAWRRGQPLSPADEVRAWANANPDACAVAMADRYAADA